MQMNGENVNLQAVVDVAFANRRVELAASAREKMQMSRSYIMNRVEKGEIIYGVNTGFGAFSSVSISQPQIVQLQKNLIEMLNNYFQDY